MKLNDKDFQKDTVEIEGIKYKIESKPTDICWARLPENPISEWRQYQIISDQNDIMELKGIRFYGEKTHKVLKEWIIAQGRLKFLTQLPMTREELAQLSSLNPYQVSEDLDKKTNMLQIRLKQGDISWWNGCTDVYKAFFLIKLSSNEKLSAKFVELNPLEKNGIIQVLFSLLEVRSTNQDSASFSRPEKLHNSFNALSDLFAKKMSEEDSKLLDYLLPRCCYDHNRQCDGNIERRFVTCSYKGNNECKYEESLRSVTQRFHRQVNFKTMHPDLRSMLENFYFSSDEIKLLREKFGMEHDDYPYTFLRFQKPENKRSSIDFLVDLSSWNTLSSTQKADVIINAASLKEETFANRNLIYDTIYQVEKNAPDKTIKALLQFLLGGTNSKESVERVKWIRAAHDNLVLSLTDSIKTNGKFTEVQNYILPHCNYQSSLICDATKRMRYDNIYCHTPLYLRCSNYDSVSRVTEHHKSAADHADLRDLLINIDFTLDDIRIRKQNDTIEDYEYPYRIAAYAKRLLKIKDYLKCRACGGILYPDLTNDQDSSVYSLIYFTCPTPGHDNRIYINHCYKCKQVIDERECKYQSFDIFPESTSKMWLCMRCGGTDVVEKGTYCPSCKRPLDASEFAGDVVRCGICEHDGSNYGIRPYKLAKPIKRDHAIIESDELPFFF